MYLIAFFIEMYGIIAVSIVSPSSLQKNSPEDLTMIFFQQRLGFIRVYLYLTLFVSLLVTSAGVLRGVTYFTLAV